MKVNLICKLFGHKYFYYKLGSQDLRVCKCCHQFEYWTTISGVSHPFWMIGTQYKEKGAKAHVVGYGK